MKSVNEESRMIARRFVSNVKTVCEQEGRNIGDIERAGGVSARYLSRLYKNDGFCGLYNAFCIAREINIPLDNLLNRDLYKEQRIKDLEEELRVLKGL